MITFQATAKFNKPGAIVLLSPEQVKSGKYPFAHAGLKAQIAAAKKARQFSGEAKETFPVVLNGGVVILAGIGKASCVNLTSLRETVRAALISPILKNADEIEIIANGHNALFLRAVIEGALIGGYSWTKYKSKAEGKKKKKIILVSGCKGGCPEAATVCEGVNFARDHINDNADIVYAAAFEKSVRKVIAGKKHINIDVLGRKEMQIKGLRLHLAVNQGSNKEPRLIIVKYLGAGSKENYTALVGKGVTFDTGGLNLKPSGHIETMRSDMSGAAAVLGTLKNAINLKLKKNLLFVFALAENAIGSGSYKPGDVITGYGGKSVEIANTDAEGRLILADAIAYVIKNYNPARVVDIATLTGACVVALGHDYTGLVTTDEKMAHQLLEAGEKTDDRAWRLPSYPELKDAVKSQVADIRNLGFPKGAAGTITAAEFLRHFAEGTRWAHLDIAGTAFVDGASRMYFGHGATGAGVRLLTHFVQNS